MILGSEHVYFQPPENLKMVYPAIVYQRDYLVNEYASNIPYRQTKRYQVTYISRSASEVVSDKISALPMCTFSRFFAADNLNHYVYSLYF